MARRPKQAGCEITRADGSTFILPTRLTTQQERDVEVRLNEITTDMPEWETAFDAFLVDGRSSISTPGIELTLDMPMIS